MNRGRFIPIGAFGLALAACAPEFDQPSEIESLRVLAVQKDKPYARPGETVTLTMLDHDGSPAAMRARLEESEPPPLQRLWLGGCENPRGDLYVGCFEQFARDGLEGLQFGSGARFPLTITDDIITRRDPPLDPNMPPYGVAYVFFAICAGQIDIVDPPASQDPEFPIVCLGPGGERLDQDHFVVGYSTVYVYEEIRNSNPRIRGFEVEGDRIPHYCIGQACVPGEAPGGVDAGLLDGGLLEAGAASGDAGADDAGTDAGAEPAPPEPPALGPHCDLFDPLCVPVCTEEDDDDCPEIPIRAVVDRSSRDEDAVLSAAGTSIGEQMWLNYYVERGTVTPQVKLLNDATKGWNPDHGTDLRAPKTPGPFYVWGVAHDNRGGVEWVRASFYAREP